MSMLYRYAVFAFGDDFKINRKILQTNLLDTSTTQLSIHNIISAKGVIKIDKKEIRITSTRPKI